MIAAVRTAGSEPLLQLPRRFGAAEAEALVRRLNASPATRVRFWSIGNEPLLRKPDIIQEVHAYLMRIAPAMKKADPTIEIFVFDECEMRAPAYEALCGGTLDITGKNPDGTWVVDGFTFHRYPFGKEFTRDDVVVRGAADIRKAAVDLVAMMARADQKHGRTGAARLKWGLTEANVTWANPDRRVEGFGNPSFVGGQFLAEVFGVGMELGAFTVAPWCISETDHAETDFGYLGLPPEFHPRSSYYHTQLMARHMGGSFVPSRTNEAKVKSIATRDGDGLAVMLLNQLQDRDLEYDLALSKDATSTKPLAVRVDGGLAVKVDGRLPRETTTLLRFDGEGRPLLLYTYGRQHNVENQPPEVLALSPNAALPKASTPAGYAGSPFGDRRNPMAPQRIPGRLQCELFDVGGPGVAYSDSDGRNSGSSALNPLDWPGTPTSTTSSSGPSSANRGPGGASGTGASGAKRVDPGREVVQARAQPRQSGPRLVEAFFLAADEGGVGRGRLAHACRRAVALRLEARGEGGHELRPDRAHLGRELAPRLLAPRGQEEQADERECPRGQNAGDVGGRGAGEHGHDRAEAEAETAGARPGDRLRAPGEAPRFRRPVVANDRFPPRRCLEELDRS
jgi:hypothetical protein